MKIKKNMKKVDFKTLDYIITIAGMMFLMVMLGVIIIVKLL